MIQLGAKVSTKKTVKALRDIRNHDIPDAQVRAGRVAARKTITRARRDTARGIKVPQKYITSRFTGTGGKKSRPVARVTVRHLDLNPAGTKKYPNAVSTVYSITKTGKKRKGHGAIKAIGGKYDRAFLFNDSGKYRVPIILQRVGGSRLPIRKVSISLDSAVVKTKVMSRTIGAPAYAKEFRRQIQGRINRRVTR